MKTVKIRKIGNSLGVVLPKDVLAMLNAGEGDELAFESSGAGVTVKVSDAEVDAMLSRAEDIMARRHKVLKALSK